MRRLIKECGTGQTGQSRRLFWKGFLSHPISADPILSDTQTPEEVALNTSLHGMCCRGSNPSWLRCILSSRCSLAG